MLEKKSENFFSRNAADIALAAIVVILFFAQAKLTLVFLERLPTEDFAESVRSPYWWVNHTVFNGVSSSVAYYILHTTAFKVFGYSVYMAKWLRLGLHFFSLISLAILFRKWMGARLAMLPLLVAGLSPTWMFFNTNQAQFGIDLQYAPIMALIAFHFPLQKRLISYFYATCLGIVFIWSALTYPTTIFLFPSLFLVVAWRWWVLPDPKNPWEILRIGFFSAIGMAIPVAASLLYVKDPQLLIYDDYFKSGLFRGGGHGFTRQPLVILEHYQTVLKDFFVKASSYSLGIPYVEFNSWLGRFGLFSIFVGSCWIGWVLGKAHQGKEILKSSRAALFFWLVFSLLFFFNAPQLIATFPGLRRVTGSFVYYYALVAYVWWALCSWPELRAQKALRAFLFLGVLLHFSAHLVTYEKALKYGMASASDATIGWLKAKPTLAESLVYWEKFTRDGGVLNCVSAGDHECRYAEIFGAIQGYRYWNKMEPSTVFYWDPALNKARPLEISLWENHERSF